MASLLRVLLCLTVCVVILCQPTNGLDKKLLTRLYRSRCIPGMEMSRFCHGSKDITENGLDGIEEKTINDNAGHGISNKVNDVDDEVRSFLKSLIKEVIEEDLEEALID
ncbi:uncharacterized protein LOC100366411 [Saccoglossus kowalevskii]|uniref:Uncharacterized protein LOC100366411 n=1 Tax=Saccoglossus kowalevskii TaxID=10224 RepID=A0ABM0GTI0_SACKO|nr:PREDICTED: uncharacterized protein LOC100366411 [Saccoglossus kowalevskii]